MSENHADCPLCKTNNAPCGSEITKDAGGKIARVRFKYLCRQCQKRYSFEIDYTGMNVASEELP